MTCRCRRRGPGGAVRRTRVWRAESRPVEGELHVRDPTLSDAFACTVTEPETVVPPAGAVTETVGAVVSLVTVALASFEGAPTLPAASSAVTR